MDVIRSVIQTGIDFYGLYRAYRESPGVSIDELRRVDIGHAPGGNGSMPHWCGLASLPNLFRQYVFQFKHPDRRGVTLNVMLLDRVCFEARVLGISPKKKGELFEPFSPSDMLIGYGGFDYHYDRLEKFKFKYEPCTLEGGSGCEVSLNFPRHINLADGFWPLSNVHVMFGGQIPLNAGDRLLLDGHSCAVWFSGGEYDGELGGGRSFSGQKCVFFLPKHVNLREIADDVIFIDETKVERTLLAVNPVMHRQELRRLAVDQTTIQLGFKGGPAGLLNRN